MKLKLSSIIFKIKTFFKVILRPNGRTDFLSKIPYNSYILDVGCGNNSPFYVKSLLPNSYYVGIDICDYNLGSDSKKILNEYILSDPNDFVKNLKNIDKKFDAVISCHNLEHCNDRSGTLNQMIEKLNSNGKIYLSFPSKESMYFPKREGTLNYYDDPTHLDSPPDFEKIIKIFKDKGLKIIFSKRNYKPLVLNFIGIFTNLISFFTKRVHLGLWERWGFESIIIAEKPNHKY